VRRGLGIQGQHSGQAKPGTGARRSGDVRARGAVASRATALDRLAEHDTAFAQYLRIHVRTGIYCRYETGPANPIEWNVST
jgi:hypothetical protein